MILINSSPKNALKIFQPFLPIFLPIGIGCLIAYAERAGVKFRYIDEQVEDNIIESIKKHLRHMEKPYIFGFSVLTASFQRAVLLSQQLKQLYPDSKVVFGGIHPSALPEETLSYDHVDIVVRREGEKTLLKLYHCIKNHKSFEHINNISFKSGGKTIHTPVSFDLEPINTLPLFPYHIFNNRKYDLGFVVSSRGCPYRCIFCSNRVITGRKYRMRSAEHIIEELKLVRHKYHKDNAIFLDDNFLVNQNRIFELIDGIRMAGLDKKMTFSFQARADNANPRLLQKLYDAGFKSVFFGIETSSDKLMKIIKKDETVQQNIDAVRAAKQIGFHTSATFMYALPTETHSDRMDAARLSRNLKLDMVRFNNTTPYPGTELYELAKKEGRLNVQGLYENFCSVSTFIENPFNKIPFSYIPKNNTEQEIRRDILYSYFSFYVDPYKVKQILMKPNRGVSWFSAGASLIEMIKKLPALTVLFVLLFVKFLQFLLISISYRLDRLCRSR